MLEKLSRVQSLDLQLDVLNQERGQTPEELIQIREEREKLGGTLGHKQSQHQDVLKQVKVNEGELQALEERRKRAADAAVAAGNSKEASQYQNQELQFATRVQELEEDTMPLLERVEALEEELKELEQELSELEPKLEALIEAENARVEEVNNRIAGVSGERDALAREVDATLLKQYEQVRRAKRGVGLVEIKDNQRCGGCNMRLPIHVIQKARTGRSLTRCPSCGRILWSKD